MALTGALFAGVSGINSNGNAMNIIGDNIANANTIGFKSSRAVFFDLLTPMSAAPRSVWDRAWRLPTGFLSRVASRHQQHHRSGGSRQGAVHSS